MVTSVVTRFNKFVCNGLPYLSAFLRSSVNQCWEKSVILTKSSRTLFVFKCMAFSSEIYVPFPWLFANFCLLFDSLVIPSVSLSAMNVSFLASSSGLVTTMEVSGVTKLYFNERLKASAVAFPFSSGVPLSLLENIFVLLDLIQILKIVNEFRPN